MNSVNVEGHIYNNPPNEGFIVAHFLTVADVERSINFYEQVFDALILSRGNSEGKPGLLQIANTWLIVNLGGGPTPDKPDIIIGVPNPDKISGFMNIRVSDIQASYALWKSRGAEFLTQPKETYSEIRCYLRDPDGYLIEIGQSKRAITDG
jgi:predicted enzyme related to lactoylglutathione lyase